MGHPIDRRLHRPVPGPPQPARLPQPAEAAPQTQTVQQVQTVQQAQHSEPARLSRPARPLSQDQLAVLANAVKAAPSLLDAAPCRLRAVANRVELHAAPSPACPAPGAAPGTAVRAGRVRTISCGAALRNLELGVRHLGLVPQIIELPDRAVPAHLATVLVGAQDPCTVLEERLYRAVFRRFQHRGPLAPRPVPPSLALQLHAAGQAPGVATMLVGGAQLRSVVGVLAADASPGRLDELVRGRLLLATTAEDGPADWLRAGHALQNVWLTAATFGLVGSALGAMLDAPGVRSGLVERLGLTGVPQVVLRLGWPAAGQADGGACPRDRPREHPPPGRPD